MVGTALQKALGCAAPSAVAAAQTSPPFLMGWITTCETAAAYCLSTAEFTSFFEILIVIIRRARRNPEVSSCCWNGATTLLSLCSNNRCTFTELQQVVVAKLMEVSCQAFKQSDEIFFRDDLDLDLDQPLERTIAIRTELL